jgi:ribonuclease III
VKVSGSGASRRAAEQAAAKKALDEVMAVSPALAAKPRRSKGARAARTEPEVVPGVAGVQGALDLRTPERRERAQRSERPVAAEPIDRVPPPQAAPVAVIRAAHVQERLAEKERGERSPEKSTLEKSTERPAERPAEKPAVPEAVTNHPAHRTGGAKSEAAPRGGERAEAGAQATESRPVARGRDAAEAASPGHPAATGAEPDHAAVLPVRAADAGH